MRPASSFSFLLLTAFVTLIAWTCLAVMILVFLLWSPFAWLALKIGSGRKDACDSSSAGGTHSLLKQTSIRA
jgi:hypothetical protein